MGSKQQVAFGFKVEAEAVNLHNFGFLTVKQRAGQRVLTLFSYYFNINCGRKIARAVRFYIAHLQMALFGNARRVNKVNAVLQNRV